MHLRNHRSLVCSFFGGVYYQYGLVVGIFEVTGKKNQLGIHWRTVRGVLLAVFSETMRVKVHRRTLWGGKLVTSPSRLFNETLVYLYCKVKHESHVTVLANKHYITLHIFTDVLFKYKCIRQIFCIQICQGYKLLYH